VLRLTTLGSGSFLVQYNSRSSSTQSSRDTGT
jgi:hypothetical protein